MKVYQCINAVQKRMSADGITKGRKNQQQGYAFRGIDDVLNALSPILAEFGLCVLPRMMSRECVERQTKSGGALFYVTVDAEFDFVAVEDGSKHTVKTYGEAMDSADKATNKAMSAAYKYAAILAFAIPTEGDNDADAHSHEVAAQVKKSFKSSPTMGILSGLPPDRQEAMNAYADAIKERMLADDVVGAYELAAEIADPEEKTGLWSLLDSKARSAIKRHSESLNVKTPDVAAILRGISGALNVDILKSNYESALQMLDESHHAAINKATQTRKHELTRTKETA